MAFDLSSVSKTTGMQAPLIGLYGTEGVGKTTVGANARSPIFLQTEEGEGRLTLDTFPIVKKWDDVIEALNALLNGDHDFKTLVVDSLDHLEPIVWQKVCELGDEKGPRNSIEEFGYGKGYKYALTLWREFMGLVQRLRKEKQMAIILIAHCNVKRFDSPMTEPYDRYMVKLHEAASAYIREKVDALLFAHEKTVVQKTDAGFGKSITRGVSTGQRIVGTQETAAYQAKNRYSMPKELPLTWDAIESAILG